MPFNMAYKIEALERDLSTLASLRAHEPISGIRLVWGFLCQGGVTPFFVVLCHSILLFDPATTAEPWTFRGRSANSSWLRSNQPGRYWSHSVVNIAPAIPRPWARD